MLDPNALAQLNQIKKDIVDSKDIAEGVVRGTSSRFGFVVLDDGRDIFLPPDTMQQVFPGDRVRIEVKPVDEKRSQGELLKLLSSSLKQCVGRYQIKGRNHFVEVDHPQLNRWLFVPPKQRKKFETGDYVNCQVSRHPFGDGRAQVSIKNLIGKPGEAGIERRAIIAKFELQETFSGKEQAEAEKLCQQSLKSITADYDDMTDIPFVTIDGDSTRDMDDALFARQTAEGHWEVFTAIADPGAWIAAGSTLDKAAQQRSATAYLTGGSLSMFPSTLSEDRFSLVPDQERPALVCRMVIDSTDSKNMGAIIESRFQCARIRSRRKMSYQEVSNWLADNTDTPDIQPEIQESLQTLQAAAKARNSFRRQHHLLQEDNPDYRLQLNEQQQVIAIEKHLPTPAHKLVEEAMLATNLCAAKLFADNKTAALFSAHDGFRPERLPEVEQRLKKDKVDLAVGDLTSLEGFAQLMRDLQSSEEDQTIAASCKRLLRPGRLSTEPDLHFGLGFSQYTQITSPIRRYQDLFNQRILRAIVNNKTADTSLAQKLQLQLQEKTGAIRQACRQLDHWLICRFMADKTGEIFNARVMAVSNQGIGVRLDDTGAEGFIQMRGSKSGGDKPRYDSIRMQLSYQEQTYYIGQPLAVTLTQVDTDSRTLTFEIASPTT